MYDVWDSIPCTDCPHRKGNYCEFYKTVLDEIEPGIFIPCMQCEDEHDFSVNGP